ncbi:hypothetical protein CANINC_004271 [Pichia inconspicua]|uniref:Helicase ATP-binding domain-containing protein n=1 Tax=Pichia inconspicua TaxID=52247 RepID=A0A4T0WXT5_9ASCO|nr:hypothetical protein CANINC_004271 [[Candida] inconspicua]
MSENKRLAQKFLSALAVEKKQDYESTHELLSSTPPKVLAKNGLAILNLVIDNIKTSFGGKLIVELSTDSAISGVKTKLKAKSKSQRVSTSNQTGTNQLSNNDFRPGDIVKLDTLSNNGVLKKLQNSSKSKDRDMVEIEQSNIEGVVTSSNNNRIAIALSNDIDTSVSERIWSLYNQNSRVWIVKINNETTYRRMESTLRKLSEFSLDSLSQNEFAPPIVQYLLKTSEYHIVTPNLDLNFINNNLNSSQKEAIKFGLVNPLTIIHGPPGTGKTSTIVEFVLQHLKLYKGKRVLITAPSNIAADTIIERLSGHFKNVSDLIRIGHPARVLESTRKHSLDYLVANLKGDELKDLQNDITKLENEVRKPRTSKAYVDRRELWKEIKLLNKELRMRNKKSVRDVLVGAKVVVATLHGSGSWEIVANIYNNENVSNKHGFGENFFHTVIIDEVSQAFEPSCWIPIINHGPERVVLAGDNKQLPPTIHISETDNLVGDDGMTSVRAYKILSQSLFDRIVHEYGGNDIVIPFIKFLDTQYRMCEKVMHFPSNEWYHGKLKAADSVKNGTVVDLLKSYNKLGNKDALGDKKVSKRKKEIALVTDAINEIFIDDNANDLTEQVIWIDTQGGLFPESMEEFTENNNILNGGSKYNIGECYLVQKQIAVLTKYGVKEEDIGIIAPYSAQVARLRSLIWYGSLDEEDGPNDDDNSIGTFPNIEISTVDGFQGREKEIIILSLVRSNLGSGDYKWLSSDVGFLSDFRRLNVSITRCKKQLVVVGDMETIEQSGIPMLKDWCEWCFANADIRYPE